MSQQSSVRDQVSLVLGTINARYKELTAREAAEFSLVLASLLASTLEREAECEGLCNLYKVSLLTPADGATKPISVAEADTRMRASDEWREWQKVKAMRIGIESTIMSLKKLVAARVEEQKAIPH